MGGETGQTCVFVMIEKILHATKKISTKTCFRLLGFIKTGETTKLDNRVLLIFKTQDSLHYAFTKNKS